METVSTGICGIIPFQAFKFPDNIIALALGEHLRIPHDQHSGFLTGEKIAEGALKQICLNNIHQGLRMGDLPFDQTECAGDTGKYAGVHPAVPRQHFIIIIRVIINPADNQRSQDAIFTDTLHHIAQTLTGI